MKYIHVSIVFLLFLFLELGLLLPQFGGSRRTPTVQFYIDITQDGIEVLREEDMDRPWTTENYPEYWLVASLRTDSGPYWPLFEWEETKHFDIWPESLRTNSAELSPVVDEELSLAILNSVYEFAKRDSKMSRFKPGSGPFTVFSFARLGSTIYIWVLMMILPALLTCLVFVLPGSIRTNIAQSRAYLGLCVHCTYDCTGLESQICPECGQNYATPARA